MITHKFGCANRYTCYIDKYFRLSRKSVFYGQKIRCIDFYNNNIDQGITLVTKCIGKVYAPAGYVTTDKYPYNEYCVHPLNTYVKSK